MSQILDKIRKLLELSKSDNQHEAALAAERAAKLMTEHQISEMDLAPVNEVIEIGDFVVVGSEGKKNVSTWKGTIANGCAKAHGAKLYTAGASFRMIGRERDVQTVHYMYSYLSSEVDRLADKAFAEEVREWQRSGLAPPHGKAWKNGFRRGAADEIFARLTAGRTMAKAQAKAALTSGSTALIKLDKLEEMVKHKAESMKWGTRQVAPMRNTSGYGAGREAGKGIDLGSAQRPGLGAGNKALR